MNKTMWILLISLGLAFTVAAYIGIRMGKNFGERMAKTRVFHEPPNEHGYFSISRSPGSESDFFSAERENYGGSGSSAPTELLFKSRGNFVFILVVSPVHEKTEVPQDLLLRLVSDKR